MEEKKEKEEYLWTADYSVIKFLITFTILSIIIWIGSFFIIEDGARILSIPAYMAVSLDCIFFIDKYAFREVNLVNEFKNGNVNVGLWLLGLFILATGILTLAS